MKRKFWTLLCILSCLMTLQAQRERNYLYYLDATQSMKMQVNIWEPTKNWLFEDIRKLQDGTVTVVPFQEQLFSATTFDILELDNKQLEKQLEKINGQLDKIIERRSNTNICSAWSDAMRRVDPSKDNYVFILTDGIDNVNGIGKLTKMVSDWCATHPQNVHVFYVMLTKFARDEKLVEAINACNDVFLIDGQGRHLPPFGAFSTNEITVNTRDFRPQRLSFSAAGKYDIKVVNTDTLFSVSASPVENGSAVFTVSPRNKAALEQSLRGVEHYYFDVRVTSDTHKLKIVTERVKVHVINKPERILYIQPESTRLTARVKHYPSFLFWKANEPDTFALDLHELMNDEASFRHATATFELVSDELRGDDYQLYVNGQLCPGHTFTLTPDAQNSRIGVIFSDNAGRGKYIFTLHPVSNVSLDRINESQPEEFSLWMRAKFRTHWNPLAVILMILGLLSAAALLVWFLVVKPLRYPKFRFSYLLMTGDDYQNVRVRGSREVRFVSERQRQSLMNRLFTGRVIYRLNPFADAPDWRVLPRNHKSKKGCRISAKEYALTPVASLAIRSDDQTDISLKQEGSGNIKTIHLQIK